MKNINKILYSVGALPVIYILMWYYKNNYRHNDISRIYVNGGYEKISYNNIQDSIYASQYVNDTLINDVKVASNIAYVIIKEHFKKNYLRSNNEFKIYSVNKELWAIYSNDLNKLLLLMQKKDCKILYINCDE